MKQTQRNKQRKNNCNLCGNVLDYDLDDNYTCHSCGYTGSDKE